MDDVKNLFGKLAKSVSKTSGDLVKSTKLSFSLSAEEEKLKIIYLEIGKKVHEIYNYGGKLGDFFDGKYREIIEIENSILQIKNQIADVKGTLVCSFCNQSNSIDAEYCSKCGNSIHQSTKSDSSKYDDSFIKTVVEVETTKLCPNCGKENNLDVDYCINCGRKFVE